jgi:GTP-binding protein
MDSFSLNNNNRVADTVLSRPTTTSRPSFRAATFTTTTQLFQSDVFDADKVQTATRRWSSAAPEKDDPEWKFFDTARVHAAAGDGGTGCVAFRREKGEARGGPNGGRGGRGGSVYMECDAQQNTLMPCRQRVHVKARPGKNGAGKNRDGVHGDDVVIYVPPGTLVRDLKTQKLAGELREPGDRLLVAKGGRGGRGNAVRRGYE